MAVQPSSCVATIGSFDGVHLGHQSLLKRIVAMAKAKGVPSVAIIFEPLPKEYFGAPYQRLSSTIERMQLLTEQGIDRVFVIAFNAQFQQMTAQYFIDEVLVRRLRIDHLVVGDDFRFGVGRQGDFAMLKQSGAEQGFTVEDSASYCVDGLRVSSTAIRNALAQGQLDTAQAMLGRPYAVSGKVIYGRQLGRTIGFATANINLKGKPLPIEGVYAVTVHSHQGEQQPEQGEQHKQVGEPLKGVANVGIKPTIGGVKPTLEVHVFDFSGNLYGQRLTVTFERFIRSEQKFDSIDALKAQIAADAHQAKQYLTV